MDNIDKIKREVEEVDIAMMDLKKVSDPDNCKEDRSFRAIQD